MNHRNDNSENNQCHEHNRFLNVVFGTAMLLCAFGSTRAEPPAWGEGLSDRELAIQRWFAHLTFLQDRPAEDWVEWHEPCSHRHAAQNRMAWEYARKGIVSVAVENPATNETAGSVRKGSYEFSVHAMWAGRCYESISVLSCAPCPFRPEARKKNSGSKRSPSIR
jgi:hypothetical protein